ncbi:MAG: hypothetical protein JO316_01575 [Abitibacteriaceae bacterium]|nr:hypothetical protein [Abditibacteriaceae bacterium]MBV9864020.1 hypothetical protein [Abditibacteriaceae bacterium]
MKKPPDFHITIGAALEGDDDIATVVEHHLRLAKAALLYADKVTLCSPIALILTPITVFSRFTERQQLELVEMVAPSIAQDDQAREDAAKFFSIYRQLLSKRNLSVQELRMKASMQNVIRPEVESMKQTASKIAKQFKADQFERLLKTGRLEIKTLGQRLSPIQWIAVCVQKAAQLNSVEQGQSFNAPLLPGNASGDTSQMLEDFIHEIEQAIKSSSSYPLFDDFTGNLVRLGLREGKIDVTEVQVDRAKPVGLAADLMERLPTFDDASVDEILDIRKELDKPLVRFRGAMVKFSRDMKSAAWSEDFPLAAEEVFRAEVQPAVAEIEDSVASNKWLYELGGLLPEKPLSIPTGGALGAGLSGLSHLPALASVSIGAAVGLGVMAIDSRRKWAEKQKTIESNQLFFYYKASKMLSNKHR